MYHLNVEIIKLNNITCGLSTSAGNLLTFFLPYAIIDHAGTVMFKTSALKLFTVANLSL